MLLTTQYLLLLSHGLLSAHSMGNMSTRPQATRKDPSLLKIVDWLNRATANELTWIQLIRMWYYRHFLDQLRHLQRSQAHFLNFCRTFTGTSSTDELFDVFTVGPLKEEKREGQQEPKGLIALNELPEPIGPSLDAEGTIQNPPPLSAKSRHKISGILPVFVEVWEERIREKSKGPLLKQCPKCETYFIVSRASQKFCQTPARDRPINPRTGKPRPPCRVVAYQGTQEYKKKTARKMAKWRANKDGAKPEPG